MNHFFVFQNKSYKQEYGGGYLWASKTGRRGVTKSYWRSMERAQAGDIIFSSVNKHIKAVAYVKDKSYECPRPEPVIEGLLEMDGLKLDVEYFFLKNPLSINPYRNDLVKV